MAQKTTLTSVSAGAAIDFRLATDRSVHLRTTDAGTGLTGDIQCSNEDTPSVATDWAAPSGLSSINITTTPTFVQLPPCKWARLNLTAWTSGTAVATWYGHKQHGENPLVGM